MRLLFLLRVLSAASAAVVLVSCSSSGPRPAKPGTPAFFWGAAESSYKTGDYAKVAENLDKIPAADTEFRPRADVWQMMILAGLAKADMEWADTFATGSKFARDRQLAFLKTASSARTAASQNAMRFAEVAHRFMEKYKDEELVLAFTKPGFAPDKPAELERLAKGATLLPVEVDKAHDMMRKRGVRLEAEFIGATDAETRVKRPALLTWMAQSFVDLAEIYNSKNLNHAGRQRMLLDEAREAIGDVPPSDTTKKLAARVDALIKKLPKD